MVRYKDISKKVGYDGFSTYPSKDYALDLLWKLKSNSFKSYQEALSLYRFLPEAKDQDQIEIVGIINRALVVGDQQLFKKAVPEPPAAMNYWQLLTNPYKAMRTIIR